MQHFSPLNLKIDQISWFRHTWSRHTLRHQQSILAHSIALRLQKDHSLKLCHAQNGQPVFHSPSGNEVPILSLSHSQNWVMVGTNKDGLIGVDIEASRPCPNAIQIARDMFSHREAAKVTKDTQLFLGLWVIREAIAKMQGSGLSGALAVDGNLVLDVLEKGDVNLESDQYQVSYRSTGFFHFAIAARFNVRHQFSDHKILDYQPFWLTDAVNSLLQCE